jgi:hypothetical protein
METPTSASMIIAMFDESYPTAHVIGANAMFRFTSLTSCAFCLGVNLEAMIEPAVKRRVTSILRSLGSVTAYLKVWLSITTVIWFITDRVIARLRVNSSSFICVTLSWC